MIWQPRWSRRAEAEFNRLERSDRERISAIVRRFAETERGDIQKLRGRGAEWRLRVGDWRVILEFDHESGAFEILRVVHRREAYR